MNMRTASITRYTSRIHRVITFITNHLDEPLTLDILAREACFSSYHFHRLFTAIVGETPGTVVTRLRLEKAAKMLVRNPALSITDIAFTCGFSSSSAFSRSFKQFFGFSASELRTRMTAADLHDEPLWKVRLFQHEPEILSSSRSVSLSEEILPHVTIQHMPAWHVAYVTTLDGYHEDNIRAAWETLVTWTTARDLRTPDAVWIGISYDSPDITAPDQCRYSVCMPVPEHISGDHIVSTMRIAAGKYAMYHVEGMHKNLPAIYRALYAEWFPNSGYQPGHTHSYEIHRSAWPPSEDPPDYYLLDIYIPVTPL